MLAHLKCPNQLSMVVSNVQWQMVPQRILIAAHSNARRIAKAIGTTGPSALMAELDLMDWSVALVARRVGHTTLPRNRLQVDVDVKQPSLPTCQASWVLMLLPQTHVNA